MRNKYPYKSMKNFTVEEATRSLALIRPIVLDIQGKWAKVKGLKDECDAIISHNLESSVNLEEKEELLDELLKEIERYIEELQDIGVNFRGFEEGIIDFPTKLDSRLIHLCWQLEEETVNHWHEIFEGFQNRKPITPELEEEIRQIDEIMKVPRT
ncbi:DUF2203 domain-containing protein [Candidatus Peregrinibacteria bacterium]|jgi:hypothetical protein|nr:DUF2203 domain-containing protein [Candidatus Peregrinibacteria bacterium]